MASGYAIDLQKLTYLFILPRLSSEKLTSNKMAVFTTAGLSEYELQRAERIARNKEKMQVIFLTRVAALVWLWCVRASRQILLNLCWSLQGPRCSFESE